jgi:hypothetical protein
LNGDRAPQLKAVAAYWCPIQFWQSFLVNASTSFIALGVGLIVVNIYLERDSRRSAVESLLTLTIPVISSFHNTWFEMCWAKFGLERFAEIGVEYIKSGGKPECLQRVVRDDLYRVVKNNANLATKLDSLENTLIELSGMAGWDLDARLIGACLDARKSISRLKEVNRDDSEQATTSITEHILDTDLYSQKALNRLAELAGVELDKYEEIGKDFDFARKSIFAK